MTREEAIADIRDNIKPFVGGKSLDMAIKALEQEPCEDCVSRRAVFEILNDAYFLKIDDGAALQESVRQLPPVTPKAETVTEFADRCRECGAKYGKLLKQEPCGDAVSRQAVIEAIDVKAWGFCDYLIRNGRNDEQKPVSHFASNLRECVGEDLPPVTPQQKMGKWKAFTHSAYRGNDEDGEPIWRKVTVYHCDLCNRRTVIKEKYCPSCGHKMQEVEE